ncbi:hypothetical protein GDO81_029085 [Engystomops pustulosus]|uniref:Tetraspanin n=1 Tax=Engystomops pustulosus TaxID=76066 RepID=A0AAV6ZD56_ENGPU|nr:hypothetical protein GDO81_029085 [Engystomops pustulosus]
MEGDSLSCVKYLMFIFNFFIFLGGSFLLGLGLWVIIDPTGFREIIAANPLMFMGAYLLLAMGAMLFLLGFLGCCGAIRENKCLLLFFFMFILVIFLAELSAAILAFLFRENLTRDFFTKDLKRHYQGNNSTDVFTSTWNSVMMTVSMIPILKDETRNLGTAMGTDITPKIHAKDCQYMITAIYIDMQILPQMYCI